MNGKIGLLASSDRAFLNELALRCMRLGLPVTTVQHAARVLQIAHEKTLDVLCVDVRISIADGAQICEMLATDSRVRAIPTIILVGSAEEAVLGCCRAIGANRVTYSPDTYDEIEPLITRALEADPVPVEEPPTLPLEASSASDERPTLLCIDDEPEISRIVQMRLEPHGIKVVRAYNGMEGYRLGLEAQPDVILTDLLMPDGEGNYVFGRFHSHPLTRDVPIIILTGQTNPALKRQMLALGAAAYLTKPLVMEELLHELKRHIVFPAEQLAGTAVER